MSALHGICSSGRARALGSLPCRMQDGAIVLLATVVLVILASLGVLLMGQSAVNEQRVSGINTRSKEVYAAASGAMDYAIRLLELDLSGVPTLTPWDSLADDGVGEVGDTSHPTTPYINAAGEGGIEQGIDTYVPSVIYTLLSDEQANPVVIEIQVTVAGQSDSHWMKTVRSQVLATTLFPDSLRTAPAVVIENCTEASLIASSSEMHPFSADDDPWPLSSPFYGKARVGTIYSGSPANGIGNNSACIDTGLFSRHKAEVKPVLAVLHAQNLHEALFGEMTKAEFIQLAVLDPERFMYVSDPVHPDLKAHKKWRLSGGQWIKAGDLDVVSKDVIVYFDTTAGCPRIGGAKNSSNVTVPTVIHGLVYYEAEGCGGGGGNIHGTLAFSGNLKKIQSGGHYYEKELDFGRVISVVPGSWKDD